MPYDSKKRGTLASDGLPVAEIQIVTPLSLSYLGFSKSPCIYPLHSIASKSQTRYEWISCVD